MAPLRVSTTKSEWLPDDPTAFVPTRLWKLPFITTWDDPRNQNRPTDSAEEASFGWVSGGALPLTSISYTSEKVTKREGIAHRRAIPAEFGTLDPGTASRSPPAWRELI